MPLDVGKCPMFPYIGRDTHCVPACEVPDDMIRMRCDPFIRLLNIPTKSSLVKKCDNPCAPKDSLDLALSACYDQHRQWWAPRAATRMQCETYRLFPYGRCQTRLCRMQCLPDDPSCQQCIQSTQRQYTVNHEPYRNNNSHLDCHIGSPHISNSARGFARSTDGLFFNC